LGRMPSDSMSGLVRMMLALLRSAARRSRGVSPSKVAHVTPDMVSAVNSPRLRN
jgi:hypothetical protein